MFYSKLVLFICVIVGIKAQFPSDLPRCKFSDLQCLPSVITQVLRAAKDGRPDMNLPPIEPLTISKLDIEKGGSGPIQIKLNFRDQELTGISGATVKRVVGFEKDPRTSKYDVFASIPKLTVNGKYKINGKILVLPISGKGRNNLTLDDVEIHIKFKPKVTSKNGKNFIQVDKLKISFETSRLHLRLDNLFNGDKALGENMNVFLNENWKDILQELKPSIVEAFVQIISNIINSVFKEFAYEDAFLPE